MTRAEEAALKALPNYPPETYPDEEEYIEVESERNLQRAFFRKGYEQAEKDLALTWEDMKQIAMISVELSRKRFEDFYVHQTISDEEHFSEVLKRFNEQRKK